MPLLLKKVQTLDYQLSRMLFVCCGVFFYGKAGPFSHEKSAPTVTALPQSFQLTPLVKFPWWSSDSSQALQLPQSDGGLSPLRTNSTRESWKCKRTVFKKKIYKHFLLCSHLNMLKMFAKYHFIQGCVSIFGLSLK